MTKTLNRCAAFICAIIFTMFTLNIIMPLNFCITSDAAESEAENYNVIIKLENEDGTPFNGLLHFDYESILYNTFGYSVHKQSKSEYLLNLSDGNYKLSHKPYAIYCDYNITSEIDFTIKGGEITSLSKDKYCRQEDEHTIVFTFVPIESEQIVFTTNDAIYQYNTFYMYTKRTFSPGEVLSLSTPSGPVNGSYSTGGTVTCSYTRNGSANPIEIKLNQLGIWGRNGYGYMLYVHLSNGETYRVDIGCEIEELPVTTTTTAKITTTTTTTIATTKNSTKPETTSIKTIKPTIPTTTTSAPELCINRKNLILENGEQFTITANQSNLTFVSNNKEIAIVSKTGVITAIGEGSAIISVINSDGDAVQLKLTVVKPNSIGDCNDDGTFSIADMVILQKWLLNDDILVKNWKCADIDGNGVLDVYDFCLMRKRIVQL